MDRFSGILLLLILGAAGYVYYRGGLPSQQDIIHPVPNPSVATTGQPADQLHGPSHRSVNQPANRPFGQPFSRPNRRRSRSAVPGTLTPDPRFLRVATFDMSLGEPANDESRPVSIAAMLTQFDIVAIQGISPNQRYLLTAVVDAMNADQQVFEYVLGPRVGRDGQHQQLAYIFDTTSVVLDKRELYTVEDPDDLIRYEPLVGWFRSRRAGTDEAFTFSLINVSVDVEERDRESQLLESIVAQVRADGREEDDVIMLGHFASDVKQQFTATDATWATENLATNTRATGDFNNLVFSGHFTDEFTGRAGVFDFLRQMNLSIKQALQVSEYLPVWAEFSVREGGMGSVARKPAP